MISKVMPRDSSAATGEILEWYSVSLTETIYFVLADPQSRLMPLNTFGMFIILNHFTGSILSFYSWHVMDGRG